MWGVRLTCLILDCISGWLVAWWEMLLIIGRCCSIIGLICDPGLRQRTVIHDSATTGSSPGLHHGASQQWHFVVFKEELRREWWSAGWLKCPFCSIIGLSCHPGLRQRSMCYGSATTRSPPGPHQRAVQQWRFLVMATSCNPGLRHSFMRYDSAT